MSSQIYRPRNVLITVGAGFIGCNFIRLILKRYTDAHIYNLDLLTYAGSLDNLKDLSHASRHHFVKGDIVDAELVRQILKKYEIDTIIHFAAESHVDRSI